MGYTCWVCQPPNNLPEGVQRIIFTRDQARRHWRDEHQGKPGYNYGYKKARKYSNIRKLGAKPNASSSSSLSTAHSSPAQDDDPPTPPGALNCIEDPAPPKRPEPGKKAEGTHKEAKASATNRPETGKKAEGTSKDSKASATNRPETGKKAEGTSKDSKASATNRPETGKKAEGTSKDSKASATKRPEPGKKAEGTHKEAKASDDPADHQSKYAFKNPPKSDEHDAGAEPPAKKGTN